MSYLNNFNFVCRVCLKSSTTVQLVLLTSNIAEKLDFIQGSLKNEKCHQTPRHICGACESEVHFVYEFFLKLKSSNFRIEHADVTNGECDEDPVVKTEEAKSQNEHCELESEYAEAENEFIHEMKVAEVTLIDGCNVDEDNIQPKPIESNCNRKKLKRKSRKELEAKICDLCDKSFSNKSNLVRHLQQHQGRCFICNYENCNLVFTQRSSLKMHMVVHSGEKPFSCHLCDKRFTQRKSLVCHLKIHTNERNYECDRCKKSFIQWNNLKRHLKGQCKTDRTTNFQCKQCRNYFATKQSLQRHYKVHERNDILINNTI